MEKYITDERTGRNTSLSEITILSQVMTNRSNALSGYGGCGCPVDTSAKGRSTDRAGR